MRHRLGTPQASDVEVFVEHDERFYVGIGATRSKEWIVIHSGSKQSSESWLLPTGDPTAPPVCVRPRREDVEYQVDHWGDRLVILTNDEAVDFRVMTARTESPDEWTELIAHEPGLRITAIEPFAEFLALHEWHAAQPRIRILDRDGRESVLAIDPEPHDVEFGPNEQWATSTLRLTHQSLTTPARVIDVDVVAGDVDRRQADPDPQRRPDGLRGGTAVGDRRRRRAGAGRRRPPRRHAARRHGGVLRLRLRLVRDLDAPVVLGGPAVAARSRRGLGARPPPRRRRARTRRGTSTASCSPSATRSPTRSRPATTSSRPASPPATGSRSAAAAPAVCWSGPASRSHPSRFSVGRRRGAVPRRRHHDERPVAAARPSPSGRSGATREPSRTPRTCSATRPTTTPGPPTTRRCSSRPGSTTRASATTSRPSGRRKLRDVRTNPDQPLAAAHRDGRRARRPERPLRRLARRGPSAGVPVAHALSYPGCDVSVQRQHVRARATRRCGPGARGRSASPTTRRSRRTAAACPPTAAWRSVPRTAAAARSPRAPGTARRPGRSAWHRPPVRPTARTATRKNGAPRPIAWAGHASRAASFDAPATTNATPEQHRGDQRHHVHRRGVSYRRGR